MIRSTPLLARIADRLSTEPRFDIGRNGSIYLQRWTLFGRRSEGDRAVYLHHFLRGDWDDALHDHPWPFVSVILAGGYYEHTPRPDDSLQRRWYGPGRVLVRPATWRHRVELPHGRECWSLVFRGAKAKSWAFYCLNPAGRLSGRVVPWRSFIDRIETGVLGCGE